MEVTCLIHTYGKRLSTGVMPLKKDMNIELSNEHNGFVEMKIGDEAYYVHIDDLIGAANCIRNGIRYPG